MNFLCPAAESFLKNAFMEYVIEMMVGLSLGFDISRQKGVLGVKGVVREKGYFRLVAVVPELRLYWSLVSKFGS